MSMTNNRRTFVKLNI